MHPALQGGNGQQHSGPVLNEDSPAEAVTYHSVLSNTNVCKVLIHMSVAVYICFSK